MDKPIAMPSYFVKRQYEGVAAKRVVALAGAGIGYYVLENLGANIVVAVFRVAGATPRNCARIYGAELERAEELERRRMGMR